jgi:hypothetical protein
MNPAQKSKPQTPKPSHKPSRSFQWQPGAPKPIPFDSETPLSTTPRVPSKSLRKSHDQSLTKSKRKTPTKKPIVPKVNLDSDYFKDSRLGMREFKYMLPLHSTSSTNRRVPGPIERIVGSSLEPPKPIEKNFKKSKSRAKNKSAKKTDHHINKNVTPEANLSNPLISEITKNRDRIINIFNRELSPSLKHPRPTSQDISDDEAEHPRPSAQHPRSPETKPKSKSPNPRIRKFIEPRDTKKTIQIKEQLAERTLTAKKLAWVPKKSKKAARNAGQVSQVSL